MTTLSPEALLVRAALEAQGLETPLVANELNSQQIEFNVQYTADGVLVEALLQVHRIEALALKIQDVTRGREALKIVDDHHD